MTSTQFVDCGGDGGFWAYDVALRVFLKHLIDAAVASDAMNAAWLSKAATQWHLIANTSEHGLTIDPAWSETERLQFIALANAACVRLSQRESIPALEIANWPIFDNPENNWARGAKVVFTAPVVELGQAIISLASGTLPEAPACKRWFYGTPTGRQMIGYRIP